MKITKKSLWLSAVSIMLCIVMLLGTTFAWFTDSVTNKDNVIEAGNLNVDFYWFKWDKDANQFVQKTAQTAKMSAENWEPGQSDALLIRVDNVGNLSSFIQMSFDVTEDSGLSEALWFNVKTGTNYQEMTQTKPTQGPIYSSNTNVTCMSELEDWEDNFNTVLKGRYDGTEPEWRRWYLIEYGMYADADNEYMNGSMSADIHFNAKQATVETDGFGSSDYDADAEYEGEISTEASLVAAAANGGTYKLTGDIALEEVLTIGEGTDLVLDLDGNTISSTDTYPISNSGNLTLINGSIKSDSTTENPKPAIYSESGNLIVENCTFESTSAGATHLGNYTIQVRGGTAAFNNCTVIGKRGGFDVGNDAQVTVTGGTYAACAYYPVYIWGTAQFKATGAVFKKIRLWAQ